MLLMSWGGEMVDEAMKWSQEARRTVKEVLKVGIDQWDIRGPNLLWNEEYQ